MLMPVVEWKNLWAKRATRIIVVSLGLLVSLSGVGVAGYYLWPEPAPKPPPPVGTATTQESRDYLASNDFRRLPLDQRVKWLDDQRKTVTNMSPEDRRNLWQNTDEQTRHKIGENMRATMEERFARDVSTFNSLPPSERDKFLDKKIDEMQQSRGGGFGMGGFGMGGGPPRGDRGPRPDGPPGGPGPRPDGFRGPPGGPGGGPPRGFQGRGGGGGPGGRMARMPADQRAEFSVYRRAMAKRMAERGLAAPGGRPGGR